MIITKLTKLGVVGLCAAREQSGSPGTRYSPDSRIFGYFRSGGSSQDDESKALAISAFGISRGGGYVEIKVVLT